ncbi:MAG: DUF3108 domain-containing protein [Betaproteobacteria bacterium]|nr:DUF3108 domain-containing protein [Betaproteobacteria bacterium]
MTGLQQQRLMWALLISLLLHLAAVLVPGQYSPGLDDELSAAPAAQIDAYLGPLPRSKTLAPIVPAPAPRKKRQMRESSLMPLPSVVVPESAAIELPPSVPGSLPELAQNSAARPVPVQPQPQLRESEAVVQRSADAPASVAETMLPRQGHIRFSISRGDQGFVVGQSVHRWSHDGKRYILSSVTETTGLAALFKSARVLQSSEGEIDSVGLRPAEFRTERNGTAGEAASFDWAGMKLRLSAGSQREVALVTGAQDMLSMFYQLGTAYTAASREPNAFMVATGRKFERYPFEVLREEMLTTKPGELRAAHLRTVAGIEAIDIWVGLDLHGLPVKIRYTDRQGETFEQSVDEIEFDGMPTSLRNR